MNMAQRRPSTAPFPARRPYEPGQSRNDVSESIDSLHERLTQQKAYIRDQAESGDGNALNHSLRLSSNGLRNLIDGKSLVTTLAVSGAAIAILGPARSVKLVKVGLRGAMLAKTAVGVAKAARQSRSLR